METLRSVSFFLFSLASVPFNEDYARVKRERLSFLFSQSSLSSRKSGQKTAFFPVRPISGAEVFKIFKYETDFSPNWRVTSRIRRVVVSICQSLYFCMLNDSDVVEGDFSDCYTHVK